MKQSKWISAMDVGGHLIMWLMMMGSGGIRRACKRCGISENFIRWVSNIWKIKSHKLRLKDMFFSFYEKHVTTATNDKYMIMCILIWFWSCLKLESFLDTLFEYKLELFLVYLCKMSLSILSVYVGAELEIVQLWKGHHRRRDRTVTVQRQKQD